MPTRVSDAMMYGKGEQGITRAREKMVKNQEQAVTGKSVNRPSDNPVSAMKLIGLKAKDDRDTQVSYNLDTASSFLNMTDSSLSDLTDLLNRAKELAIQMSSTSNFNEDSRLATAHEIEQLMYRAIQVGNARVGDRYLFGGYQTDRPPFDMDGNYFGDSGSFELEVDQGHKLAINLTGVEVFYGKKEIGVDAQKVRDDLLRNNVPSIDAGLRKPASATSESSEPKTADSLAQRKIDGDKTQMAPAVGQEQGVNIFLSFKNLMDGLKDGNIRAVQSSIEKFDEGYKQVLSLRTQVGSRQNLITASQSGVERSKVGTAELMAQAQDADTFQVFSDLAKNEHTLNASLEANKRLLTPSLLDFLK